MFMSALSDSSVKEPLVPLRRYSGLPPSYDASTAEPHGFIDGMPVREGASHNPPQPLVPGRLPVTRLLPQDGVKPDSETAPLFLDPATGEPRIGYATPNELQTQCTQSGHVERTKYGTLSIIAAAMFFPWGLLCMIESRLVYCERCGLVIRAPRGRRDMRRGDAHENRPTHYSGRRRTRC